MRVAKWREKERVWEERAKGEDREEIQMRGRGKPASLRIQLKVKCNTLTVPFADSRTSKFAGHGFPRVDIRNKRIYVFVLKAKVATRVSHGK